MTFSVEQARAIVETQQPELYRLAYSLTRDAGAADEISQESLLSGLSQRRLDLPVDAWLARRVVDACRMRVWWLGMKAWVRDVVSALREAGSEDGPAESGAAYSPSGLWPAYQSLNRAGQRVLALRYFHNYPVERIAILLRTDPPGVRRQLGQARDLMDYAVGGPSGMLGNYNDGINHTQARQLLQSAADLRLSGPPWMALQTHLEICPACRAYRKRLDTLQRELARALAPYLAPPQPAGPQAAARVLAAWEKRLPDTEGRQSGSPTR